MEVVSRLDSSFLNGDQTLSSSSDLKMAGNQPEEEKDSIAKSSDVEEIDLHIKHPLQNTWVLWFFETDRNKEWTDNVKEIASFSTVEDFWSLYNHIKCVGELRMGCDYSLFKKGIQPMWEDKANKEGGRWLINFDKKSRDSDLDNCWLEIMLCLIGESFDSYSDDVNGAVVNYRQKLDKIGVWTSDASRPESFMAIGRKTKERLNLNNKQKITYQVHKDSYSTTKQSSMNKHVYTV